MDSQLIHSLVASLLVTQNEQANANLSHIVKEI